MPGSHSKPTASFVIQTWNCRFRSPVFLLKLTQVTEGSYHPFITPATAVNLRMVQDDLKPRRILLSSVKRNVLVGKICLVGAGFGILHVILDASQGLYESVAVDLLFTLIISFAYLLNREYWKGIH